MEVNEYKTVLRAVNGFWKLGCKFRATCFFDENCEETHNTKKRKYARVSVYEKSDFSLTFFDLNYKDYLKLRKEVTITLKPIKL